MMNLPEPSNVVIRLAVGALGVLAIGIEREWSVKRGRQPPHFAGSRTFLLLGLVGALGAELFRGGLPPIGAALLAACAALIVVGYAMTSRRSRDLGGTTEVAALIVLAGGVLAGLGQLALASGLFAITTLVLAEKSLLHSFVAKLESHELMAAIRFGVLALVIFPLLPLGPFGPEPGFRPRELWLVVLIFSGLSFLSFIALRIVGLHRGYGLVGALGGLISSTAVTLNFPRESREQPQLGRVLALGVTAACTVLPVRVALLTAALNPALSARTILYLLPPFVMGVVMAGVIMRRRDPQHITAATPRNPLRFATALQMAVAFQAVLYLMDWMSGRFGSSGMLLSAAAVGLTELDALTYSMVKLGGETTMTVVAAQALAVGVISNTVFKCAAALLLGRGKFRRLAGIALAGIALAGAAALVFL